MRKLVIKGIEPIEVIEGVPLHFKNHSNEMPGDIRPIVNVYRYRIDSTFGIEVCCQDKISSGHMRVLLFEKKSNIIKKASKPVWSSRHLIRKIITDYILKNKKIGYIEYEKERLLEETIPNNKENKIRETFLNDQVEAAEQQLTDVVGLLSKIIDGNSAVSEKGFMDTFYGQKYLFLTKGTFPEFCEHLDKKTPSIVYSMLADPKRVWCMDCMIKNSALRVKEFPYTCDSCETDGHTIFSETVVQAGVMLISGNVCVPCMDKHALSVKK